MALPLGLEILRVLEQLQESVLAEQTRLVIVLAIAIKTIQYASPSVGYSWPP